METQFNTASEVAREIRQPVSRVLAAVDSGILTPAGRAGSNKNSPVIFEESAIPAIRAALETGSKATALCPHKCENVAEIRAKHSAFLRAQKEAGK
jgi:hypothetical protein